MQKALVLVFVLALLLGVSAVRVSEAQGPPPTVIGGNYVSFYPAVFTIAFPETSQPNVTVHSISNGLFTYTVSTSFPDSSVVIDLNSSAQYSINLGILYPVPISGSVSWALYGSGTQFPDTGSSEFVNETQFSLDWQVTLFVYPSFPSVAQIANETSGLLISYEQQKVAALQQEINTLQSSTAFDNHVSEGVAGAFGVISIVLVTERLFGKKRGES